MAVHELKTWPEYFQAILDERKRFEVRKNDRAYRVGDDLRLREYDPVKDSYSGREVRATIDYVLKGGQFGIMHDYCVMSIHVYEVTGLD